MDRQPASQTDRQTHSQTDRKGGGEIGTILGGYGVTLRDVQTDWSNNYL